MRNFKVKMAYNGARYHGFQRQDNALAVQQVVEEAIILRFSVVQELMREFMQGSSFSILKSILQ